MKRGFRFSWILLAGVLLIGAGLLGLLSEPDLVQYAFLPGEKAASDRIAQLETIREELADSFPLITLHGQKNGVTLTSGSLSQNDVCLYLTGPSWNEVYPRRMVSGRPVSRVEAQRAEKVIVLDEATAFRFFGDTDAVGKTVMLGDTRLEVIGVAAHGRRIGETGAQAAWVPLGVAGDCDLMVLSAAAPRDSTWLTLWQNKAAEVFGPGTMISLYKEKTAAWMLLRFLVLFFALIALKRWISWLAGWIRRAAGSIREESRRRYALRLVPFALGRLLPAAALLALTVGAGYALAVFAIEPVRIFPEWVPESLGNFSAWGSRFWDLTSAAAAPVAMKTPETAEIGFFAGLIRWGSVCCLLGAVAPALRKRLAAGG